MGKGQSLYNRAKVIIPGGTQLLSKRPEMFLPDQWPAYYSKAKGCEVWDLDGNHYYDMSYMGIGANTLGYANDEVDSCAIEAIHNGGMCTLNAPEEVLLAEKLLQLHPWAGGVRYAKAGGEAMALAVRIVRAFTKRDVILFCGYHGWHDWYLAANVTSPDALNDQHLSGLIPAGVPQGLYGTCRPFHFNDTEEFLSLSEKYQDQVAAVVMEPIRNAAPSAVFMKTIRDYCRRSGSVLVFDEITAGFRISAGGSHLALNYTPDMAVFAKGMTNGYPLAAIIGRKQIMDAAQNTFISSTFYTERIAFAATCKAIDVFQRDRVWEKLIAYGKRVKEGWTEAANHAGLQITVGGIDPLAHFSFQENTLALKTYFTQEMLKKGFLASTACYTSFAHSDPIISDYLEAVESVFADISRLLSSGCSIENSILGPVCHSGFERLN